MIIVFSYVFAVIISVIIAVVLYPISFVFWIVGKIGSAVGYIADGLFHISNSMIRKLWKDINNTTIVKNDTEIVKQEDRQETE